MHGASASDQHRYPPLASWRSNETSNLRIVVALRLCHPCYGLLFRNHNHSLNGEDASGCPRGSREATRRENREEAERSRQVYRPLPTGRVKLQRWQNPSSYSTAPVQCGLDDARPRKRSVRLPESTCPPSISAEWIRSIWPGCGGGNVISMTVRRPTYSR